MRALITGGAGFIGSHLAERLLAQGHEVTSLDDLSTGRPENISHLSTNPRFQVVTDSATNEPLVGRLIDGSDVVFHLAAVVGVRLVVDAPIQTIETNVNSTETVLREARRHRRLVVVASTSEVYGKGTVLPFSEDADLVLGPPNKRRWGYATSKLLDEFLALAYWHEHQVPTIVTRFFNTVGPRQNSRYGMVLPNFVRQAITNTPLTVHGTGLQTRCFTWVGDVVTALTEIVEQPRAIGEVFNVGNDEEISILDLARRVRTLAGSDSAIELVPYRHVFDENFEDMQRRVPNITKLQQLTGFRPRLGLNDIVKRTLEYWQGELAEQRGSAQLAVRAAQTPALASAAC
jgi:UDP-glucose 4-epimerase